MRGKGVGFNCSSGTAGCVLLYDIMNNRPYMLEPYVKSRQLFICPSRDAANNSPYRGDYGKANYNNGGTEPYGRHLDGVNVAYADGHVKWLHISKMWNNGVNTGLYDGKSS